MSPIAGHTAEQLLHEALVAPRMARVNFPDMREVERPGWLQRITPSFYKGGLNAVDLCQLDADEADTVIDATLAEYDALGIRFRWTVGPDSRPLDLGERLARRGLTGTRVLLMAAARTCLDVELAPGVQVERVDPSTVEAYARVSAEGWGVDAEPLLAYERCVLADPGDRHHSYLATIDGEPVGAANIACLDRSAYLMGAVVLPSARGRGVYRSLIAARLRSLAGRGLDLVTCQALAGTSAPILARLGFVEIGALQVYAR